MPASPDVITVSPGMGLHPAAGCPYQQPRRCRCAVPVSIRSRACAPQCGNVAGGVDDSHHAAPGGAVHNAAQAVPVDHRHIDLDAVRQTDVQNMLNQCPGALLPMTRADKFKIQRSGVEVQQFAQPLVFRLDFVVFRKLRFELGYSALSSRFSVRRSVLANMRSKVANGVCGQ